MFVPLAELSVSIHTGLNPKAGSYSQALRLSQQITKYAWSPIVFKDNKRLESNFLYSDWAVLDYENGTTLEQAQNTFCDSIHIIGTTKSHTQESNRFRVCVPWEERITDLETFRYNMKLLVERYDTDQQCKDGARFYYPCKNIISITAEGYRQDVKKPQEIPGDSKEIQHSKTGFSSAVTFFMKNEIHIGNRNTHIFQVAKDLFRIGLHQNTILDIILKSPTYRDQKPPGNLILEIKDCISNAKRAVENE